MGLLDRLFGRRSPATTAEPQEPAECLHGDLAPRWDNAADMGKDDLVSSFKCNSCGTEFSTAEAEKIRDTAGLRIKETLGE
ncbi:MAG: hypothetical protein GEU80_05180 [Dehalococcoidia bacterium]|nr:hypothetical protein [Dehalococcoidia bacterium]